MILTPNAAVRVYVYKERDTSSGLTNQASKSIEVIDLKEEIVSINTIKHKSSPIGEFNITLAPNRNWIAALTPGSWLAILMSQDEITDKDLNTFNKKSLKMIGRIDTVRMSVGVDQTTAARHTQYTVAGRDWGSIFESILYISHLVKYEKDTQHDLAMKIIFNSIGAYLGAESSSSDIIKALLQLWGTQNSSSKLSDDFFNVDNFLPDATMFLPMELTKAISSSETNVVSNVKLIDGTLTDEDIYSGDTKESMGPLVATSVIGINTLWQTMLSHCCTAVNEMFADLRFEGDKPKLALYKRIRPFLVTQKTIGSSDSKPISSSFFKVKKVKISAEQTIEINVGNNWYDVINFIEVLPNLSYMQVNSNGSELVPQSSFANNCAISDPNSFSRNGFKPMLMQTMQLPTDSSGKTSEWGSVIKNGWLPVMREWYFNTTCMLNGSILIVGLDDFIGVGDNILVEGKTLGLGSFNKPQNDILKTKGPSGCAMLAHVESIAHSFSRSVEGSRSFNTTINFVRGIITDDKGSKLLSNKSLGIDDNSTALSREDELAPNIVITGVKK